MLPCFENVYKRMFHLAERVTTGTKWEALLKLQVDVTTNIENLDNTIIFDWCGCMVVCPKDRAGTEVEYCRSYDKMMLMEHGVDGFEQRYIVECLYSHRYKVRFYLHDMETLIRALFAFCSIHFTTTHPTQNEFRMAHLHDEVHRSKTLQHRLRSTALVYMNNRRKDNKHKHCQCWAMILQGITSTAMNCNVA